MPAKAEVSPDKTGVKKPQPKRALSLEDIDIALAIVTGTTETHIRDQKELLAPPDTAQQQSLELQVENARLKTIAVHLHWMARRYADGRQSYATSLHNENTRALLEMGVPLNATGDGTLWARDSAGRAYDGLTEEEAAQGREPDWKHDDKERRIEQQKTQIEALKEEVLSGVLLNAAHDHLGMYPAKVIGGDSAREQRTPYMDGWNDANSALTKNHGLLLGWCGKLPSDIRSATINLLLDGSLKLTVQEGVASAYINCNDLFYWGCSDGEDIEISEIPALLECISISPTNGSILWACRKRGTRPQGAFYAYIEHSEWPLFDACGPVREISLANPYEPGKYRA